MTAALLVLAVGICAFAAALLVLAPRRSWVEERLAPHVRPLERRPDGPRTGGQLDARLEAAQRVLGNSRVAHSFQRELARAGSTQTPAWLASLTLGGGFGVMTAGAVAGWAGMSVILLALVAALVPHLLLRLAAIRRARAFDVQLPDLLDLLGASLRVGHGFEQALRAVAEGAAEPARSELRRALGEIRLGSPAADALAGVGSRLASGDMAFVVAAVEIQQQVGGSLADLLSIVAETVRERQQFRRKVRGLTSSGRASAVALALLPVAAAGALSLASPSYMYPLWHTATGRLLVLVALGMIAVGAAVLKRIVTIRS
jgi:tight adherence protein B